MGFRDFKRVADGLGENVHLTITDSTVDVDHQRFTYDVTVQGLPRSRGCEYILEQWDEDWFPTDYLGIQKTGGGEYRVYVGDGYSFPVTECDEVLPPHVRNESA